MTVPAKKSNGISYNTHYHLAHLKPRDSYEKNSPKYYGSFHSIPKNCETKDLAAAKYNDLYPIALKKSTHTF